MLDEHSFIRLAEMQAMYKLYDRHSPHAAQHLRYVRKSGFKSETPRYFAHLLGTTVMGAAFTDVNIGGGHMHVNRELCAKKQCVRQQCEHSTVCS